MYENELVLSLGMELAVHEFLFDIHSFFYRKGDWWKTFGLVPYLGLGILYNQRNQFGV